MYKGYVSRLVPVWYLVMPLVRHVYILLPFVRRYVTHVCMLLPLIRPHVRHAHLGLHITVSSKGKITRILSFGCSFACATTMGCAGFRLLFGTVIVL